MKAWITTYALTSGIKEVSGEISKGSVSMFCYGDQSYGGQFAHGKGKDWHLTKEGALKRADAMRLKKITSLLKQIEKLRDMEFIKPKGKPAG